MTSADALFAIDPAQVRMDDLGEDLSADRRRTVRQAQALANGLHPLSLRFGHMPLHPDAAPANDRKAPGARCRDCAWLLSLEHHNIARLKCDLGDGKRISHG